LNLVLSIGKPWHHDPIRQTWTNDQRTVIIVNLLNGRVASPGPKLAEQEIRGVGNSRVEHDH